MKLKRLFAVIPLLISSLSFAATVTHETLQLNPNPITSSAGFSAGPLNGAFVVDFTGSFAGLDSQNTISASGTNISFGGNVSNVNIADMAINIIQGNMSFSLMLQQTGVPGLQVLSETWPVSGFADALAIKNGPFTLEVTGVANNASFGGNITVNPDPVHPSAVPVPGAVWLLGSSLAAIAGIGKRRKSSITKPLAVATA